MNNYERLIAELERTNIKVIELDLSFSKSSGLTVNNYIFINKNTTVNEKYCILCEELGHFNTGCSNIIDLNDMRNKKKEKIARRWGCEKAIPLSKILEVRDKGLKYGYEIAEKLGVTEEFLKETIEYYRCKNNL